MRITVPRVPIVAIVGRPNVGKSALFNRLVGRRLAIVDETPGVTRDRLYAPIEWAGRRFALVDTAGIEAGPKEDVIAQMRAQAEVAIAEADVILFLVDAQAGATPADEEVADLLRPRADKVLLVANKVDSHAAAGMVYEFCALGYDVPLSVSAIHGLQSGDLLDAIVERLPPQEADEPRDDEVIHVSIVGQPNVGKSSLVNALTGTERAVVSEVPGTTRDATDTEVAVDGRRYVIIDTAGLRRHVERGLQLEYYSSLRAVAAVSRCDVSLLLLDASLGPSAQDRRIAGLAIDDGKALIIAVNKWDLVDASEFGRDRVREALAKEFAFAPYAPVTFVSAKSRRGVRKLWPLLAAAFDERRKRVPTAALNQVVRDAFRTHPPPSYRGHSLKCYYVTQADVAPPLFVFFVNDPKLVHFSYRRHLENVIRDAFGLSATPVRFEFRKRVQQDRTEARDLITAAGRKPDHS